MNYDEEIRACNFDARINGLAATKIWFDSNRGMPRIENWNIDDFLVNKETKYTVRGADWVGFKTKIRYDRFEKRIRDNKGNPDYNAECLEHIRPTGSSNKIKGYVKREQYVNVWEIWSKDDGLLWFCEEYKDGLVRHSEEWPIPFDRECGEFSLATLSYTQESQTFWRYPDFFHRKYIYGKVSKAATHIMDQMNTGAVKKHIYNKDALGKEGATALASGEEEFIPAKKGDMRNLMYTIDRGGISSAVIEGFNLGKGLSDERSNVSVELRGGQGKTKSATEAGIRDEWANSRLDDARRVVDNYFLPELFTKIAQYALYFMTDDEGLITRLVGQKLAQYWPAQPVDPKVVKETFIIGVEPGSTRQSEKSKDKMDSMQYMQSMVPMFMQLGAGEQAIQAINRVTRAFFPENYADYEITLEEMQQRVEREKEVQAAQEEAMAQEQAAMQAQGGAV